MTRRAVVRSIALAMALTGLLGGCAAGSASSTGQIVTFELVDKSQYKVLVTDPVDQAIVQKLAAGKDAPNIPNGRIVHETGVNTGWSWSIDPADFHFVDVVEQACNGTPAAIENGTFKADRFCPWSAIVVATQPAP